METAIQKYCKHTIFINLEKRKDRLELVLKEFEKIEINNPQRFNAISYPMSAIGCSMSHAAVLKMALENNYPYVFICEDDFEIIDPVLLNSRLELFYKSPMGQDFDVLIISGNNSIPYQRKTDFAIKVNRCYTTTAYIVARRYYETLLSHDVEGFENLKKSMNCQKHTIDSYRFKLQRRDKWYMLTPPTACQREDYSDICQSVQNYVPLFFNIEKFQGDNGKLFAFCDSAE